MDPEVIGWGAISMTVCVPEDWTNEQVIAFAEESNNPGGIGWRIREFGDPLLEGDLERVDCSERIGFVHVVLDV
jgi:hypothetical protein